MMYTTRQVADMLGLSVRRVQQAAPDIAQKIGAYYIWDDKAVEILKSRRGQTGNPNWKKKDSTPKD